MTFHPVASRKSARPSTSTVPTVVGNGAAATGVEVGSQVVLSTSPAPMRSVPGPSRRNRAINAALFLVSVPFVRWVFSKLNPRKPGAMCPETVARLTVTVAGTVGPDHGGPPSTAGPQPASLGMGRPPSSPAAPASSDSPDDEPALPDDPDADEADDAGPEDEPADDPEAGPEEEPAGGSSDPPDDASAVLRPATGAV